MTSRSFFTTLAVVTAGTVCSLALFLLLLPAVRVHSGFTAATLLLFILLCTGLFFAGQSAARSSSKLAFNSLVSVSVFGKMVLAIGFLFAYRAIAHPPNQWFLAIFLWNYIIYTCFEVWFMTRIAPVIFLICCETVDLLKR